jgi:squalene-hopene/tetraprenyl-beta-curcumene cyclase
LAEEVSRWGDWSVARPQVPPGGWAFEFANENYPDVDDTAEVVLALHRINGRAAAPMRTAGSLQARFIRETGVTDIDERVEGAIGRAVRWLEGMQSSGGGWGAFDAENTRALVRELPFLDFGEVIDEPSADVTAHALEMLAALGLDSTPSAGRGVRWLIDQQEADGSWFGRWGVNHVYGTGAAVPALLAAGVDPAHSCITRAVRWLEDHQNDDGGWGEDPRSYDDPDWVGRGPSTASQTAWALLALQAALGTGLPSGEDEPDGANERGGQTDGRPDQSSRALERGLDWLVSRQRADGTWDEPQYTGTGFPSDYYINYHLYRLTFPIMALGRCLGASRAGRADGAADAAGNADGAGGGTLAVDGQRAGVDGAIGVCSIEAQTRS